MKNFEMYFRNEIYLSRMKKNPLLKALAIFALLSHLLSCAERDPLTICDTANGEWTWESNPEIYLQFDDGILLSGARWPDGIHIYETLEYTCCCDTLYMKSRDTGFEFWLTVWLTSDTTAIINGEHYAKPEVMKRI